MRAYFIRHADKQKGNFFNSQLRHNDQPISVVGRRKSKRLFRFLRYRNVSQIYVSSYIRTEQTIRFAAKHLHLNPVTDPRLNEIDIGFLEDLNDREIQQQYPDLWKSYVRRDADFRFPEGETGAEAQERAVSFLNEVQRAGNNIVAVSHDGLIRSLLCYVLGIPVYKRFNFSLDTCGIMDVEWDKDFGSWRLHRYNYVM